MYLAAYVIDHGLPQPAGYEGEDKAQARFQQQQAKLDNSYINKALQQFVLDIMIYRVLYQIRAKRREHGQYQAKAYAEPEPGLVRPAERQNAEQ